MSLYSPNTHVFVAINAVDLFNLSSKHQLEILNKVNTGYYRNNVKFNVTAGYRIKNLSTFKSDSGFEDHLDKCYLYLFMEKGKTFYDNLIKSPNLKRETFQDYEVLFVKENDDSYLKFDSSDIKGTLGFKPHHNYLDGKTIEPTCFTTFLPKLGFFMLPYLEKHFATLFKVEQYIVEIIVEHNLLDYYNKYHNYTEIKRIVIPIDYDPEETGLEQGIILNVPMTLSTMIKDFNLSV
ncbi:hypothetical protein HANVADRAFT_54246 [Hanseniaspora valbyensis NRRL Y-1626]|uniref:Uncharacterized protein n=2 Tax=Hanseniaspora valbyensis NRRL Y-1626 TaxID=766949 RepID=A0A1B7T840_9ASCO|nr:hypothetical protein HANVADRAFT_54246 [Hanseniaspora valbyensis NRRL Y-1626]